MSTVLYNGQMVDSRKLSDAQLSEAMSQSPLPGETQEQFNARIAQIQKEQGSGSDIGLGGLGLTPAGGFGQAAALGSAALAPLGPKTVDTADIAAQTAKANAASDALKAQADASRGTTTAAPSVGPVSGYTPPAATATSLRGGSTSAPAPTPTAGSAPAPSSAPTPSAPLSDASKAALSSVAGSVRATQSVPTTPSVGAQLSGYKPPAPAPTASAPTAPSGAAGPAEPQGAGFGGTSVIDKPDAIKAQQAAGPNFNEAKTEPSRGTFVDSVDMAKRAALGQGPSGASLQAALDIDRATKQARALAAANQGRSVGGALVAASNAASNAAINIDAQAQAAKAREMEQARGQYIAGAGQVAGLDTNRELTLTDLGTKTGIANAQLGTEAGIKSGELALAAAQANQGTDLAARTTTAQLGTQVSIANADRDARTQVIIKDLQLRAAQGDQDAILRMKQLDDARLANDNDAFLRALGIASNTAIGKANVDLGNTQTQNQFKGAVLGTGGQILTSFINRPSTPA